MHKFQIRHFIKGSSGFALVSCISGMVLLLVIAVGLLTLSTTTVRTSSKGEAMATARSNARLAMMLAILVLQHVREHLVLWGRFLPVVQYFMRHAQISRSGVSAFTCWHGWAGVDPSQRAIAPWQDVMLDMSVDEWVRDLIVG